MANSFIQAYVHYIFTVKGRVNFLKQEHNDELQKYITGIIQNRNCKMLAINNMSDHVHLFIGLKPAMALSDLIRDVKNNSSNFINDNRFLSQKFAWQKGYGGFSYANSQIESVYNYILNQE